MYPRVDFIVTNLSRPAERVVAFYNHRGAAEQYIKEGKNAIMWTRLSGHTLRNNEVRLKLHALAYNLANFMRTLALPKEIEHWSLSTIREKLGQDRRSWPVCHVPNGGGRRTPDLFRGILERIDRLRRPAPATAWTKET